ncbi:hypothetical protein DFQ30_011447 [Apophysomyces sp. BC1015]|nr:hypothetical protein DFQ30_011447 [Apophysomyces sp. BC1015]
MVLSDNEQDDTFAHRFPNLGRTRRMPPTPRWSPPQPQKAAKATGDMEFSTSISWPIFLAVIPTLGAFVAGSAELWSDFVMILLILYYVYKWITVPWSYYEGARSRRIIHQNATQHHFPEESKRQDYQRRQAVMYELRRHELVGLIWVIVSPAVAGYTLQYSRYFLSNHERYLSAFNVTVFVLAASLKPLAHVMTLLRERTLYLQSEVQMQETPTETFQKKLDCMEEELLGLQRAFATKKDLGQVTNGLTPTIQQLSKAVKRLEKKEMAFRSLSEDQFATVDQKIREFDQFICYRIEQDQRKSTQWTVVTLMFLPLNIVFWIVKRMSYLLPLPRGLLESSPQQPTAVHRHSPYAKHLTNAAATSSAAADLCVPDISRPGKESPGHRSS